MRQHILVLAFAGIAAVAMAAQPARFNYQGIATDGDGTPLEGNHPVFFSLYRGGTAGSADSGTLVYRESANLDLDDGVINHTVGTGTASFGSPFNANQIRPDGDYFLQVGVDNVSNSILPRTRLESVPFAITSADGDARIPISGPLPVTITQSGSYYLTQNLTATGTTPGIEIAASHVTLDLNGYTVTGGTTGTADGVFAANRTNVTIRNGTVRNWGDVGVFTASSPKCHIEGIRAISNGSTGLNLGTDTIARDCQASGNGGVGIAASDGSIVENCVAVENASHGIQVFDNAVVRRCTVARNTNQVGLKVGNGALVTHCTGDGDTIDGDDGTIVESCVVRANGVFLNNGINVERNSTVRNCVLNGTQVGINAGAGCLILSNNVSDTTVTGQSAIVASQNCTIVGNSLDGISNAANSGTRAAGIGINTSASRVEGNTISDFTTATQASTSSAVVGNFFDNNVNNLGNSSGVVGPVTTSGNILTQTNPHANLSY